MAVKNTGTAVRKRIGWFGSCPTPYCGSVEGYFCLKCHIYTADCACHFNFSGCRCETKRWWAGKGERRHLIAELLNQREELLAALNLIAFDDEVSYLACSNLPHCLQNPHNEQCAVGIARAAIAKARGEA